ncbi:MAG: ATP-binding protein [Crocinitomicaceae bacterium]
MSVDHVERALLKQLDKKLKPQKVLILLGARRVGKTELLHKFLSQKSPDEYQLLNGEDQNTQDLLAKKSVDNYKQLVGKQKLLVIDEAQKIPEIGQKLKLMVDAIKGVKIIATGSSVFDLTNQLGEPLVGRSTVLKMFPVSQLEFGKYETYIQTNGKLYERLLFGGYPELVHYDDFNEKIEYLDNLVSSYLLRDILEFEGIKKSGKLVDLLRLLAFQIGKEVSIDELAVSVKGISRNTVEHYLNLLEKVFVIYKVEGFSRNLRKEVTKTSRWYFYDNGVRNALIKNFNSLDIRADIGELWENYIMAERMKYNAYKQRLVSTYFWRTYDQQEIDLIEECNGQLSAFEFKWNTKKKVKPPGGWKRAYPKAKFHVIHPDNYLDYIT